MLAAVAAVPPAGLIVIVVADRAYDVPAFIDRVAAHGRHWGVRCKANGSLRFQDRAGQEHGLRDRVRARLPEPGRGWKERGQVFKDAGWRPASVVGQWARGPAEPLVVLTDLPPHWRALRHDDRRFWIEPGFRTDKTKGWQWERSQVRDLAQQARLLLAMAWASLVLLCLGVQVAQERVAARPPRPGPAVRRARAHLVRRRPAPGARPMPARACSPSACGAHGKGSSKRWWLR